MKNQDNQQFYPAGCIPDPLMQAVVKQVAQYKIYSTLNISSAYDKNELPENDKVYSAFQADVSL